MLGKDKNMNKIYIVDFGLAKRWKYRVSKKHIKIVRNKTLTGTARYVSLNTHIGIE